VKSEGCPDPALRNSATDPTKKREILAGSYHTWNCGSSFADGHAELRKWLASVLRIPVRYGYNAASISTIANNADWQWFSQRAACRQP